MAYLEVFCGLAAIVYLIYYYLTVNYNFWKVRGVTGPKPVLFFGTLKDVIVDRLGIGDYCKEIHEEYKSERMVGLFAQTKPILLLNDPDLIKDVLIKDFSKFSDRGIAVAERADPLSCHLFAVSTERWRPLRARLSPVFTSGKLKEMFGMILDCSNNFEKYIENLVEKSESVEVRDLTAKFTTDVIGTCAFGVETNSLMDEDSEFRRMGKQIFTPENMSWTRQKLRQFFPKFYDILGFVIPYAELTKFFIKLTTDTIKFRRKNNVVRHDFIHMLMELQDHPEKMGDIKLDDNLTAAQCFVFFAAGFETSSTTMSNALYELALNQDIQKKLHEEINETYKAHNGDLQYDTIKKMQYLDKVFRETLRKYPPVTVIMRKSVASYTFEGTKVTVPTGQRIWIPAYGIQRDPEIYPDPEKFDPERFNPDVVATRNPMHYLPFGDGPRNCIGARFAVYQTKIGIIKIIRSYKVEVCDKTPIPYVNDPRTFLLAPAGGIHLKFTKYATS